MIKQNNKIDDPDLIEYNSDLELIYTENKKHAKSIIDDIKTHGEEYIEEIDRKRVLNDHIALIFLKSV